MSPWLLLVLAALCLLVGAVFSGSETGLYSVSRLRVEADARAGRRGALVIRSLLQDEATLLVTILLGNNLVVELMSRFTGSLAEGYGVPAGWRELAVAVILTPIALFFGDLLPKDLFRRRPHALVGATAPLLALCKGLLLPLTLPLRGLAWLIERALGITSEALTRAQGRERVLELLQEMETGAVPQMERLARNVLQLRAQPIERVMVPWKDVQQLVLGADPAELFNRVARAPNSRLPVVEAAGGPVIGYVHQLEVLGAGRDVPLSGHLRPLVSLEPGVSLEAALEKMRASGQRAVLVGPAARPLGILTLKDIVEEISGELSRW